MKQKRTAIMSHSSKRITKSVLYNIMRKLQKKKYYVAYKIINLGTKVITHSPKIDDGLDFSLGLTTSVREISMLASAMLSPNANIPI